MNFVRSIRMILTSQAAVLLAALCLFAWTASAQAADPAFRDWLAALWPEAQGLGVSRATFESATRDLEPDLSLPDLVIPGRAPRPDQQPEFIQSPADYVKETTIARLAAQGRTLLDQHRATLVGIERQFGVAPTILLALWGRETAFGTYRLPHDAVRVLATQAYLGRRKQQFRQEFLLLLKMLGEGAASRAQLRSSWAGAMGLTQFLPSEFYKHGVDFDRDGRVDIWTSVADALASAAKQLVDKGWEPGGQWAYEVRAPAGVDCTSADPDTKLPLRTWLARGFAPAHGRAIKPGDLDRPASLVLPEGIYGPAFLAPKNYFVIKEYNFADLYVIFVGHLSDRMADARPFEKPWAKIPLLRTREVEAMQQQLTAAGLYRDKIDGKAGMKTRLALGAYQKARGLKVDCWPTQDLLSHMQNSVAR